MTRPQPQPSSGRREGRHSQSNKAKALSAVASAAAAAAQAQQAATPAQASRRGLTPEEVQDLLNALDVLCSCYADGINSPSVKRLLKDYAPGTKRGTRARRLFNVLPKLIDRLIDENPSCPRWASQAVDRLNTYDDDFITQQHQELNELEGLF